MAKEKMFGETSPEDFIKMARRSDDKEPESSHTKDEIRRAECDSIAGILLDWVGHLPLGLLVPHFERPTVLTPKVQSKIFTLNMACVYVAMSQTQSKEMDYIAKRFTTLIQDNHAVFGFKENQDLYLELGKSDKYLKNLFDTIKLWSTDKDKGTADAMRWGIEYFNNIGINSIDPVTGFLAYNHVYSYIKMVNELLNTLLAELTTI